MCDVRNAEVRLYILLSIGRRIMMFGLVSQSKFVDREIKAHESNDVCEEVRRSSQTSSSIKE